MKDFYFPGQKAPIETQKQTPLSLNLNQEAVRAALKLSEPRVPLFWLRCRLEMDETLQRFPDL